MAIIREAYIYISHIAHSIYIYRLVYIRCIYRFLKYETSAYDFNFVKNNTQIGRSFQIKSKNTV
jgi:hypothetical protein